MTMELTKIDVAREAAREKLALGRRFVDGDVTPPLSAAAVAYAESYAGDFSFMREMKQRVQKGGLTRPMVRAVLNCVLADERKKTPSVEIDLTRIATMLGKAKEKLQYPKIRLAADGLEFQVYLSGPRSKEPGSAVVTAAERDEWTGDRRYFGRISLAGEFKGSAPEAMLTMLRAFAADPEGVAAEYGKLTGACCFCGSELTDGRSTGVGYGPTCAKNYGLVWGVRN